MIDFTKAHNITDLLLLLQVLFVWLWIWVKAWRAITCALIRRVTGRTPKGRVANAVNDILDVYGAQSGQKLTLTASDGWEIIIVKREGTDK